MIIAASTVSLKTMKNIGTEKRFFAMLRRGEPGERKEESSHNYVLCQNRFFRLIGVIR